MIFKAGNIFIKGNPRYLEDQKGRIERELAKLIERAKRKKFVEEKKISGVVRRFIYEVNLILKKLELRKDYSGLSIEEVIKLHKIDEYLIFLQSINHPKLIPELRTLKERAKKWVDQDSYNLKKIWIDTNLIRNSILSHQRYLKDIEVLNYIPYGFPIVIYCKNFNKVPPNAVIVVHGFLGDRRGCDLLSRRIASKGYLVCSFELPGHYPVDYTKFEDEFRLGLACEYIFNVVKFVRKEFYIRRVAVMGHSAGGVAALFSLAYYNKTIEDSIYFLFESYLNILERLSKPSEIEVAEKANLQKELEHLYNQIKLLIFNTLKQIRFDIGRIDAVVALAPPKRFQIVFTPSMAKAVLRIKELFKTRYKHPKTGKFAYGLVRFRTYELEAFLSYIINIKNPCDYMNLINFFSNLAGEKRTNLIKYYRDKYILAIPKFILYGGFLDIHNRLIVPANFREYKSVYSLLGNVKIKSFPLKGHWLSRGFDTLKGETATSSKVVFEIMDFLEKNL